MVKVKKGDEEEKGKLCKLSIINVKLKGEN